MIGSSYLVAPVAQELRFFTEWLTHLRLTRQQDCDHHPYGVTQFFLGNKKGRRGDLSYLLFRLFFFALFDPLPDFYANEHNDYYAVTEEHRGIVLNPSHLHGKQGKRTKSYEYLKN
ncbi:hypothetical protein [Cronobacter dublinensis]|uniref:hypothetical protein n=1 Tax=Cronobacter dublinensis TaxID=413497 RepID=UPI001319D942|nr:hypothetical protein [Cronobacter dublinensis]